MPLDEQPNETPEEPEGREPIEAHIHPLDFNSLEKGSWIETEELVCITRQEPGTTKFSLAVLGLETQITRETGIMCRTVKDRIRLMDDVEASIWSLNRVKQHVRGQQRQAANQTLIDLASMTDEDRRAAEARARIVTGTAMAAQSQFQRERRLAGLYEPLQLGEGDEEAV